MLPIDRQLLHEAVPDPVAIRRELRERLGIPQEAFIAMFCGKYVARKRPLDLVISAHNVASKGLPVWSLLVGEGPERANIESVCQQKGIKNAVLTGFVNQSKIPTYFAAADVVAVTSQYDPHPLVVSEGASFGLPVIASDKIGCIGVNDTARPDVNALVYTCSDQGQLSDCIERLYRDRTLYRSMSQASVKISEQQDVNVAAQELALAANQLHEIGPR